MAAQEFAQAAIEVTKKAGFFARHFDKAVAIAKAHPVGAVAVGIGAAAVVSVGGYYGVKKAFGDKKPAAKPAEAKPEAAAEQPKEDAAQA